MRSIAREVGVSPTLVSQLFRGDPNLRISDARRKEIFAARDRMGGVKVRPSRLSHIIVAPQGGVRTKTYTDQDIRQNPLYRTFEQMLAAKGYQLQYKHIPETEICGRLKQWIRRPKHPDGLLILSKYCTPELADLLKTHAFPHVSDDFTREHMGINTVCSHHTGGMRQLIEHLVSLGHRHIAFAGVKEFPRYSMMVSAMAGLDLPLDTSRHCWLEPIVYPKMQSDMRRHASEAFDGWYAKKGNVTALVCSNDYAALGVLDAMRRRGLVAGRDLSVVGYDNLEEHRPIPGHRPILTTVDNPLERVGRRMAELLLNQIEQGQHQIVHERLPASLVVRETTGPAPERTH